MGKKRALQLLEQLKTNQQQDLQNAAGIFTVAQVAVNELQQIADADIEGEESAIAPPQPLLPAAPVAAPALVSKTELTATYGNYNACRKAAKEQGIKFKKQPTWDQIVAAFSYKAACQQAIHDYLKAHPSEHLKGVSLNLSLD
ncbi:MAG: hypothetical protein MUF49_27745 [Oculatellaceae cyanobacterium Prado106]|jgi:hypothetical protein|nr:hypothetical protein [Oculatellaceae cyanobacterium Prado106]